MPSLLLRTTGLIDFKTFYSNSSLCSPHIISTFLEFLLLLMTCFGKTFLHFLIFLKFFLHITFCCLSSLLLQEWWLITELGFLFMSIFHFSIISGGEKLSIFCYFCIGKDHTSALLLQMTFCIWHIQSSSSWTEPLSWERQKRRNHASLLIKSRQSGSNSWLTCHVVLHIAVLWEYSLCRQLK